MSSLVKSLEQDAAFAMSLGSKELFHSNHLAFFIGKYPEIDNAVTDLTGDQAVVRREKNHTDLLVEGVPRLVIENKVFDFPDEGGQLSIFLSGQLIYEMEGLEDKAHIAAPQPGECTHPRSHMPGYARPSNIKSGRPGPAAHMG